MRRKLSDFGKKISEDLKARETKPLLVNQQCVVYEFQCNSCDSNYIGYTSRHLHLRIEGHKYSVIVKHLKDKHNERPTNLHEQFTTLKRCRGKFECLIYEMLLIRKKRPTLNSRNGRLHSSETVHLNFLILLFISRLIHSNVLSRSLFSI